MSKTNISYFSFLISLLIHSAIIYFNNTVKYTNAEFQIPHKRTPKVFVTLIKNQEIAKTQKIGPRQKESPKIYNVSKKDMNDRSYSLNRFKYLIKRYISPIYPKTSIRKGEEGIVIINLTINKQGNVSTIKLISSSQSSLLDNAAINAAKKWTFKNKKEIKIKKRVVFKLD
jgi:TonB family protein